MAKWMILGLLAFVAIIVVSVVLAIYIPRWTAGPLGRTEEIQITQRGPYRIQGYEKFYDLHEEVTSVETKLQAYPPRLSPRQVTECRGLLARRADVVSEYNRMSQAERTIGQWRADNLPYVLQQKNPRTCEEE